MHSIEIPAIGYYREIPADITELSPEQYLDFVELFLMLTHEKISYHELRIKLLDRLVGFSKPLRKLKPEQKETVLSEIYRLSEIMDSFVHFVESEGSQKPWINLTLVKNLVPEIRTRSRTLYGPADALTDLSFFEYIDAHNHYSEFLNTASEESLDKLIAVLYRPEIEHYKRARQKEDFDGQRRVKYNSGSVEARAKELAFLPYPVKFGIFLFYHGCEDFLRDGEISLGDSRIRLSVLYEYPEVTDSDDTGLVGVLYTLAESQVFGNAQQTADTNLYDVMVRLYQLMKTYKRQEKALHHA
ncbi:MAG: hypothetical protein AB9842_07905 [Bacteroidales bacterium]